MVQSGGGRTMANHLPSHPAKQCRPATVKVTVGAYGENLTTIERKEVNEYKVERVAFKCTREMIYINFVTVLACGCTCW